MLKGKNVCNENLDNPKYSAFSLYVYELQQLVCFGLFICRRGGNCITRAAGSREGAGRGGWVRQQESYF